MSVFEKLNAINVNGKTKERSGLTYLSWAWAWGELKKAYPLSTYTIYENADGWFYHTDGITCWVKTGVTVTTDANSIEHIEYLPVMDYRNKSIPADKVTSFDVNKAIQRSLTKAVARHGLGLYIYADEDLPEAEKAQEEASKPAKQADKEPDNRPKRIQALCDHHKVSMETFGVFLKELQNDGKVSRAHTSKMSEADFGAMLSLVHTALLKTTRESA